MTRNERGMLGACLFCAAMERDRAPETSDFVLERRAHDDAEYCIDAPDMLPSGSWSAIWGPEWHFRPGTRESTE